MPVVRRMCTHGHMHDEMAPSLARHPALQASGAPARSAAGSEGFNPSDIAELRDSKQELILKVQTMKKVPGGLPSWPATLWGVQRVPERALRTVSLLGSECCWGTDRTLVLL